MSQGPLKTPVGDRVCPPHTFYIMNILYNEWVKYLKPKGVKLPKEDTWGRKSLEFMYVNLNAWVSKEIIIEGIGYTADAPGLAASKSDQMEVVKEAHIKLGDLLKEEFEEEILYTREVDE